MASSCIPELPADVVFSIFLFCDIASVIFVGQTCRHLHDLAFHKSVWLSLLHDLKRRFILSDAVSPNLEEASTSDLINAVKRLLTGPDTWTPTSAGFTPEVAQRITLHPTIHLGDGILNWENEARLSPSGRFVLFNNWRSLECWDVGADRMIWAYVSRLEHSRVLAFAVDEVVDGDALVIMICERTYSASRRNYIQIVELDPRSSTIANLLQVPCPSTSYDNPFAGPVIRGGVATVALSPYLNSQLVLDWKSQLAFVIDSSETDAHLMDIIPGHLILQSSDSVDASIYLYLINVQDALRAHGVPLDGDTAFNSVTVDQLPKILTQEVVIPGANPRFKADQRLCVHARPLHRDAYRIWFYSAAAALLCSYDLVLAPTPVWRERTRTPPRTGVYYQEIAYSGHAQSFERVPQHGVVHQILPPIIPVSLTRGELNLGSAADPIDVSPYSGALTFATDSDVVVLYFR
ncbi:hypothetical protein C8R46DRAFT_1099222 [Mycena filopes]|nr:hypothetical protein C8R46DRAFT_1099222 [Mycena filopes]